MPPGHRRKYCRKQEKGKTRAVTNVYCLKRGMLSSSVSVTIHTRQYIYEWTHARARILVLISIKQFMWHVTGPKPLRIPETDACFAFLLE